jgi:hypothetical protein
MIVHYQRRDDPSNRIIRGSGNSLAEKLTYMSERNDKTFLTKMIERVSVLRNLTNRQFRLKTFVGVAVLRAALLPMTRKAASPLRRRPNFLLAA